MKRIVMILMMLLTLLAVLSVRSIKAENEEKKISMENGQITLDAESVETEVAVDQKSQTDDEDLTDDGEFREDLEAKSWMLEAERKDIENTKILNDITFYSGSFKDKDGNRTYTFNYGNNGLTIRIPGPVTYDNERIDYAYKLENFDKDWIFTNSEKPVIKYTNLKDGEYTFKIKRSKNGMDWGDTVETIKINVKKPFYKTIVFLIILIAAIPILAVIIMAFVLLTMKRKSKHKEKELTVSRLQAQLTQAELKALKAQLHPHFLFNTLNAISSLMHENVEAADRAMTKLGDLLRLMFNQSEKPFVSLKEEMEFINHYLEIHHIRFQDKLEITMDIAPDTLNASIPNLLLQPLVENALTHGASKDRDDNKVLIQTTKQNDTIRITIKDNGPGLSNVTMVANLQELENAKLCQEDRECIGLKNTFLRLTNIYKDNHQFKLENSMEKGLIMGIQIPYNETQQ